MATYYFRNTGDVNWGTATNWSLTDGGGATGAVPLVTDDAVFTANSGNCSINSTFRVCATLNTTGYSNTITFANDLRVNGNITLGGSTILAGTNFLNVTNTCTFTSNGVVIPNLRIGLTTGFTTTLSGGITVSGNFLIFGSTGQTFTINSNTITISGASSTITVGAAGVTTISAGTTTFNVTGTCTITTVGTSPQLRNNLTINTAGTVTISGTFAYNTGTLTYTAGTVSTTGSTLSVGTTTSFNTGAIIWNNVVFSTATMTITGNFNVGGTLTLGGGTNSVVCNGGTINASGNVTLASTNTTNTALGSSVLNLNGTGTVSSANMQLRLSTNINTSGTITFSGVLQYNTGTLTYTAGTVITTGSTLAVASSGTSLNTGAVLWNAVSITGAFTHTITGNFNVGGSLTLGSGTTTINTGVINAFGNIAIAVTTGTVTGTATLNVLGDGISITSSGGTLRLNTNLNSSGKINMPSTLNYNSGTLSYLSGNIVADKSVLNITLSTTLLNMNKVVWGQVIVAAGATLTMNEFFCGSPDVRTIVSNGGSVSNTFTLAFQDSFEKIAHDVKVFSCNVSARNLFIVTIDSLSGGTWSGDTPFTLSPATYLPNVGVRYINQLPNGVPKNNPSVGNGLTYPAFGLTSDPTTIH